MANKQDQERKQQKVQSIEKRLIEMRGNEDILLGMLDETRLDMIILALGIGNVELN